MRASVRALVRVLCCRYSRATAVTRAVYRLYGDARPSRLELAGVKADVRALIFQGIAALPEQEAEAAALAAAEDELQSMI